MLSFAADILTLLMPLFSIFFLFSLLSFSFHCLYFRCHSIISSPLLIFIY